MSINCVMLLACGHRLAATDITKTCDTESDMRADAQLAAVSYLLDTAELHGSVACPDGRGSEKGC